MKTYWRALGLSRIFVVSAALVPLLAGAQAVKPASSPASPSISVADVEVGHIGQQAQVRVEGSGKLSYRVTRQSDPPRVVIDFDGARLAVARHIIPSEYEPVRGVRLGQFTTDQVRLVIDLSRPSTFSVDNGSSALVMTFSGAAATTPASASVSTPVAAKAAAQVSSPASTNAPSGARAFPLPASLTSRAGALASP